MVYPHPTLGLIKRITSITHKRSYTSKSRQLTYKKCTCNYNTTIHFVGYKKRVQLFQKRITQG